MTTECHPPGSTAYKEECVFVTMIFQETVRKMFEVKIFVWKLY